MTPELPTIPMAAALMTALAGAGVLIPFARPRAPALQRLNDPVEDERLSLLRTLRELDREHAGGLIQEEDYHALRAETEARAVAVLRVLQTRRDTGELAAAVRAARRPTVRGRALLIPGLLAAVAIVAATTPLLIQGIHARAPGGLISGDLPVSAPTNQGAAALLEQRVRAHPDDISARLELAQLDLDRGDVRAATQQYLDVVRREPMNVEANTKLGYLVFLSGLPEQGLSAVDRALQNNPAYPDALYLKGVILLRGLNRGPEAAEVFRAYLRAAPFGSHRAEVQGVLASLEAQSEAGRSR